MKSKWYSIFSRTVLYAFFFFLSGALGAVEFSLEKKGKTPLYMYGDTARQDLSGVALVGNKIVFGFDGGKSAQQPEIRISTINSIDKPAYILRHEILQKDIEAMTSIDNTFYVLASLSQVSDESGSYRLITENKLSENGRYTKTGRFRYLRDIVFNSLKKHIPNNAWLKRVSTSFGKHGGINAEGLSYTGDENEIAIGLRSPLFHPLFGSPINGEDYSLDKGKSILLFANDIFEDDIFDIELVDLGGQGIRGMEYIAPLGGYLIISGTVQKGTKFGIWFYKRGSGAVEMDIPGFSGLCRPEAVLSIPQDQQVYILGEESGSSCENSTHNYILLSY
ncbi:hypothetical protein A9Q99_04850 [Gammaproteobacteria bacterium 45_16_T64]|nr:hypothetical protein A9Q99_04850 [Gammaproteobacteria bacterium 45_16_T64]